MQGHHSCVRSAPYWVVSRVSDRRQQHTSTTHMSERAKFESVFPGLVDEVLVEIEKTKLPEAAVKWIKDVMIHNTFGGKLNRGLSVLSTYEILTGKKELSDDEYKRAAVLGWCVELLQAYFLVADDIMDDAHTRRGQPCWFRKDGVGMIAINDAFILESAIYVLLKKYFRATSYYVDLFELFQEVTLFTELGQLLDLITAPEDHVDLSKFTLDKHTYIVTYKTAFYSFYLPVALAMYMTGTASEQNLKEAQKVLLPLGTYFQVQDDYLDLYGDPNVTGKIGTDIQDNKCGWLINVALERASPEQREILDENYGRKDSAKEEKVKKVFADLQIAKVYHDYEDRAAGEIKQLIENVDTSNGLKKDVFTVFFNKIYKRQK